MLVGVLFIACGATMVPDTEHGIVETVLSIPGLPANALLVFALALAVLFFALWLRVHEEDY
jgi:hypothetical protein